MQWCVYGSQAAFCQITLDTLLGHTALTHTQTFNGPFFGDYPGKPVPER